MSTASLAAARGTLLSIALRLLSFLLSQLTVRWVSAAALGRASIRLDLLLSTALFVGREGFRLALTKEGDDGGDGKSGDAVDDGNSREQRVVNVAWLSVPVGALLSFAALLMHLHHCNIESNIESAHDEAQSDYALLDYKLAGMLYCLASLVESLAEPLVIRCLQRMDVATKAKAEGAALVLKSLSCFGCLYLMRSGWFASIVTTALGGSFEEGAPDANDFAVTAFGASQLVYALVFTSITYRNGRRSKDGMPWPKWVEPSIANPYREKEMGNATTNGAPSPSSLARNFDLHMLYLVAVFTLQGLFKHVLTEADKIVLSALAGSYDQGVYALAASYGGLAARLLLQPVEENARLLFSRQGALVAAQHAQKGANGKSKKEEPISASCDVLDELEGTYIFLLRVVLYIGLLFATVAVNYVSLLLRVLAGSRWGSNVEASAALSAFCVYTAFLALNGTTEAFVYGVARSGNDVGKLGVAHAIVGGVFALVAPGLVARHGAAGLVAANCLSMGLRSMYSLHYARGYFAQAGKRIGLRSLLSRVLPHALALGAFGLSFILTRSSRMHIYDAQIATGGSWIAAGAQHIGCGLLCVAMTSSLCLWLDKDISGALLKLVKRKSD